MRHLTAYVYSLLEMDSNYVCVRHEEGARVVP